jgi:hypothetical protein
MSNQYSVIKNPNKSMSEINKSNSQYGEEDIE